MTKGFDDYKNGIIFGAIFGALIVYIALLVAAPSWISWLGTALTSMSNWLVARDWWPSGFLYTLVGTVKTASIALKYTIGILVGAIIGGIVDAK